MMQFAARLVTGLAAARDDQDGQGVAEYSLRLGGAVSGTLGDDRQQIRDAGR
jgi:hypothetical protein